MASPDVIQTPQITSIKGSTIRIAHPDISGYIRTSVTTALAAGGTTLTMADNHGFLDNDFFIIGEVGDAKTEDCDVNDGSITRGTTLTITNTTTFGHEIDAPITRILERGITIYGAATDGGAGTIIESIDAYAASGRQLTNAVMIQWDQDYTEFTMISTDTAYAYYYVVFTDGTTVSSSSDYVLAAGPAYNSAISMAEAGLREANAEIDGDLITNDWMLDIVNDWQDEVTQYITNDGYTKDWSFELAENLSSITTTQNEEKYALSSLTLAMKYPDTHKGIFHVRLGENKIEYIDLDNLLNAYDGIPRTEVKTEASAADTSIVLDNTYEFAESGSVFVGPDTVTYTGNTESTGTLTGIPASGTGSITQTHVVDTVVWQGVSPGVPTKYTVFNGEIILNKPPNSASTNLKIKMRYLYDIARLTSLSEVTVITIPHTAKYYLASRIESRKGNLENSERLMARFRDLLEREALRDQLQVTEQFEYYQF